MFAFQTERAFGEARFSATFVIAAQYFVNAVTRTGLVYDSRFVPPRSAETSTVILYLIRQGELVLYAPERRALRGPIAVLLGENDFEGRAGTAGLPFRTSGSPFEAIEVRIARSDLLVPGGSGVPTVALPDAIWTAAREVTALAARRDPPEQAVGELMRALTDAGIVAPRLVQQDAAASASYERIWMAARPAAEAFDLPMSLDGLALMAGLSLRQINRDIASFVSAFRVPFTAWRELLRRLRIKSAVLGLSVGDLPIHEVARLAGYGSAEALARAFRDAGLPPPSRVRSALLEADGP